ncbi:MAG TPA: MFS transporter [Mycobacteriales bacterium]|nr:MFS transporter [Mycobacteriales bacterium]
MTTTIAERIVPSDGRHERRRPAVVLITAMFGFFLVGLDASAVNVALPAIGTAFGSGTAGLQWIVDAYTLMFAVWLLSAGALGDRLGADRVYRFGVIGFTAASAACALAPGLGLLVAARLVQGTAAAVMLPSSLALIRQSYSDTHERARAIALWTVAGAVATAAGPVAGGALTTLSWRWIFVINLPVGVLTLVVLAHGLASPRRPAALDPAGQVSAAVALAALTFGVIEGGSGGFGRPAVLGCLALAGLAFSGFLLIESRVTEPMLPLSLFGSRAVNLCLAIGFAINAVFYGVIFLFSLFFQRILHDSPVHAGLMFLPMTLLITVSNVLSARVATRYGARVPITIGLLICLGGIVTLLGAGPGAPELVIALLLVPMGAGLGFVVPSLTASLLSDIAAERAGLAAGVLNSARQTGGALSVATFGALAGGSFAAGLHRGIVVSAVLLGGAIVAALALPRAAA